MDKNLINKDMLVQNFKAIGEGSSSGGPLIFESVTKIS